jgi:hypothetical protein
LTNTREARIITENSRALKFIGHGYEVEWRSFSCLAA